MDMTLACVPSIFFVCRFICSFAFFLFSLIQSPIPLLPSFYPLSLPLTLPPSLPPSLPHSLTHSLTHSTNLYFCNAAINVVLTDTSKSMEDWENQVSELHNLLRTITLDKHKDHSSFIATIDKMAEQIAGLTAHYEQLIKEYEELCKVWDICKAI